MAPIWQELLTMAVFSSAAALPNCMIQVLSDHFSGPYGNYFYFCGENDAREVLESLTVPARVDRLSNRTSNADVQITYDQPQRVGIFLDLNCDDGVRFLLESELLFNATFKWLVWSSGEASRILSGMSRLEMDSDVTTVAVRNDLVILEDVYRVHFTTELIENVESIYDETCEVARRQLPERRDFRGFTLNTTLSMIAIEFNETNLIEPLLDRAVEPSLDLVRRYGLAVYFLLKAMYNFQENFILSSDWGSEMSNGSWDGLVGQVQRREVEMATGPAEFILRRYTAVDFTMPLHKAKGTFTFLQPKIFGSKNALILPLHLPAWIGLAICCISAFIAIPFINTREDNSEVKGWGWSFFVVSSAVAQQGLPGNVTKLSGRIAHLAVLFVTLLVFIHYNAAILNGLLMPAPNAIQSMRQLLESDFKLGVTDWDYFRNLLKSNDSTYVEIRKRLESQKGLKKKFFQILEGVQMVKKGRFAFLSEDQMMYDYLGRSFTPSEICAATEVSLRDPFPLGFVLRDNSPYKEIMNRGILLMYERGVIKRERDFWLWRKPECHWQQDFFAFDFEPLTLAYVTLVLGLFLSLGALTIETGSERFRSTRNKKIADPPPVEFFH